MVSINRLLPIFVFLHIVLLLLSIPANCDEEDDLVLGLNNFRQTHNLPSLTKNDNANCLADEIADNLDNRPCSNSTGVSTISGNQPRYANYADIMRKCKIDNSTATDGVILPVCVPHRVRTLVLTNYTQSSYASYLNNSRYTGFGIGKEDDWMVLVLSTDTPRGSFATATNGATGRVCGFQMGWYLVGLLFVGFYLVL